MFFGFKSYRELMELYEEGRRLGRLAVHIQKAPWKVIQDCDGLVRQFSFETLTESSKNLLFEVIQYQVSYVKL